MDLKDFESNLGRPKALTTRQIHHLKTKPTPTPPHPTPTPPLRPGRDASHPRLRAQHGATLYVHGGLVSGSAQGDDDCLGMIPGRDGRIDELAEWVDALNTWKDQMLAEWIAAPCWADEGAAARVACKGGYETRGGQALMDYVVPGGAQGVVLGRHLDKSSMPLPMSKRVVGRLVAAGVTRLVLGHTPHGNCPTVIKQPEAVRGGGSRGARRATRSARPSGHTLRSPLPLTPRGAARDAGGRCLL